MKAIARPAGRSVNDVGRFHWRSRFYLSQRLRYVHFRLEYFGNNQCSRGRHEACRKQMHRIDTHANVGRHHTACNGCEATHHDGHDFRIRHSVQIRFDEEWCFRLANKNVSCRRQSLGSRGPERSLHHLGNETNDELHRPNVVKNRHKR